MEDQQALVLEVFTQLALTETGRPDLLPSEVEVYSESQVNLYDMHIKTQYRLGRCVVTTHRLLWLNEGSNVAICMPLRFVVKLSKEAGFLARSSKIRIDYTFKDCNKFIKLSFKEGGRDEFFGPLEASLTRKAWTDTKSSNPILDRRLQTRDFSAQNAGISGILRKQQQDQAMTSELTTQSFSDLNALMEKAKDMVGIIERYVTANSAAQIANTDSTSKDASLLSGVLLTMGIASPVTRENSGDAYHQQLARQLAQFLKFPMLKCGGIMTLSDIYCLFNRARGTELISPDDLYHAALLQKPLALGIHVRKFDGGLIVLQLDSHSEDRVASKLQKLATNSPVGSITSSDVAQVMNISLPLALEYLKVAEQKGKLCRDDTFEGLNFYPNRFGSFLQKSS